MRRFYAWLDAKALAIQLKLRQSPDWPQQGRWVVMCEDSPDALPCESWHAMSGGVDYGMAPDTGRFWLREDAQRFAAYRNGLADPGQVFYAAHEDFLQRPLPPTY